MPVYGPKVLGKEEHKRQTQSEIGGRKKYGPKVTGYVPQTAEAPKTVEAVFPLPVRGMKAHLSAHAEQAPLAARAELDQESPRKSALRFLLDFDLDADLYDEIVEKLKEMEG